MVSNNDRADIERDAAPIDFRDHDGILERPHPVLDPLRPEFVEHAADKIRPHQFPGVRLGVFAGTAGRRPVIRRPGLKRETLGAVQIDPGQVRPAQRIFQHGPHLRAGAIVVYAEENPHFESGRHGGADRRQHLASVEPEKFDDPGGKARLDILDVLGDVSRKDHLARLVVALGRHEPGERHVEQLPLEMRKVTKLEIGRPGRGRLR